CRWETTTSTQLSVGVAPRWLSGWRINMANPEEGKRIIITVLGHDQVGIIAMVSNVLADNGINILDISQTILQGFFTMVMVVDLGRSKIDVKELRDILAGKGAAIGLQITVQHEDLFNYMHRI
ncbi:MAG TPA: ACT domain-containing protein, partial [Syntrophomonas sp.]|nr:ACT domain-containing protein [Syntrophomonas sp.]